MPLPSSLRRAGPLFVLALLLLGCQGSRAATDFQPAAPPAVTFTVVTDAVPPDPTVSALIAPYHAQLQDAVAEVIGEATAPLVKGGLESGLGNMAADAMLAVGTEHADQPIDLVVTNNGGLRTSIPAGPITVGHVFEVMPFENMLTVLELSAAQVDTLAQQIAQRRGEPIAGFTFAIDADGQAVDIRVAGQPLDASRTYRVITLDYLANGGGVPALWSPLARRDLPVLLRDVLIEYIRRQQTLTPRLDGRIRPLTP